MTRYDVVPNEYRVVSWHFFGGKIDKSRNCKHALDVAGIGCQAWWCQIENAIIRLLLGEQQSRWCQIDDAGDRFIDWLNDWLIPEFIARHWTPVEHALSFIMVEKLTERGSYSKWVRRFDATSRHSWDWKAIFRGKLPFQTRALCCADTGKCRMKLLVGTIRHEYFTALWFVLDHRFSLPGFL